MNQPPTAVVAILLAAGAGQRYGSLKQLLPIAGVPMVRHAAETILATGIELTVVTGADAGRISVALAGLPLNLRHNPDWAQGMGSSIACAVRALTQRETPPSAILLCLADQPRIGTTALRQMIAASRRQPDQIIAADYGATLGPPCLFPAAYHAELSGLSGDRGARALLRQHSASLTRLAMPEAGDDIDTPRDYCRLECRQDPDH